MNSRFAPLVYAVVLAVVLSACVSSPAPTAPVSTPPPPTTAAPSPSPTAVALVTHHLGHATFVTPANWQVVIPRMWITTIQPRLFLSTDPISDPCPSTFIEGYACFTPLAKLQPDGILVTVDDSVGLMLKTYTPPPTTSPPAAWCRQLGGDLQVDARLGGGFAHACIRGPDTASAASAFLAFVASFHA